jgi:hypothetical protein
MTSEQRISLMRYIWTTLLMTIAAIIIFAGDSLGGLLIPIIIFLVGGAIPISGFVLSWGDVAQTQDFEKTKRGQKLNRILNELNTEDITALRDRLVYKDEPYGIDDDGELMYMEDN